MSESHTPPVSTASDGIPAPGNWTMEGPSNGNGNGEGKTGIASRSGVADEVVSATATSDHQLEEASCWDVEYSSDTPGITPPSTVQVSVSDAEPAGNVHDLKHQHEHEHEHDHHVSQDSSISRDDMIAALSIHFDLLWRDAYEDGDDDGFEDFPLDQEGFEPLFEIGDVVRVKARTGAGAGMAAGVGDITRAVAVTVNAGQDSWAQYDPDLGGYYSTQKFQVVGRFLKMTSTENCEDGFDADDDDLGKVGDIHEALHHLSTDDDVEEKEEEDNVNDNAQRSDSESEFDQPDPGTWLYRLKPAPLCPPRSGSLIMADLMIWKEGNLVLDAQAMDPDTDDDMEWD
ncbi:hypothetical protein A1O1_00090 [Capronia coronata CBS 617.96]|uniref:Uncharacterized protein n=1 Tax=Capronia coronata CBS 617.96 TaxID=1182541 RepID=W9YPY8_9EURO|nr:uncharacterized protein A1O1_00090 [Capronia coronata CBS 617.96]EXJ94972.1 hypothetical protein A1O1_00090 [Capronia coronata CBS 617.96]